MNSKQLLGLVAALVVSVPAFAAADQYLYKNTSLEARGVVAIQQHSVYIEIIREEVRVEEQLHQFAAVVAVVKRCIQQERQFDNAVLWFNDQFLFGDKRRVSENATSPPGAVPALGSQPAEDEFDTKGNPTWDADGAPNGLKFWRRFGASSGQPTGFNGNSDGESGRPGRWAGCFVPEGFLNAIGSDDPYGISAVTDNVAQVKSLIGMDNSPNCNGCIFNYTGSFYITDPNGFNWLIDKYVYPAVLTGILAKLNQAGNCADPPPSGGPVPNVVDATLVEDVHTNDDLAFAFGCDAEQHRDVAQDPTDPENHCFDDAATPDVCDDNHNDPTDTPRRDSTKITTLEPLYTVHLQVDPVDDQSLRDEALWAWRSSGVVRNGAPRYEEASAAGFCPVDNTAVQCAIEYNALIVIDFEAMDDVALLFPEGEGENTITRNGKTHGLGGADDGDESKAGNAHRHNPTPATNGTVDAAPACGDTGGDTNGYNATDGGVKTTCDLHTHDTAVLDLFFMVHNDGTCVASGSGCGAPYFTVKNGGFRDGAGGAILTGRPPVPSGPECNTGPETSGHGEGLAPLTARVFIVCDLDDDAGEFHAHDGSQTINAVG